MEEGNPLSLRSDPRSLVDQAKSGGPAPFEGLVQVVDSEADVMYARSAARDEPSDGRVGALGFEQLDERIACLEAADPGAVGIIESGLGEAEDVAAEGQEVVEGAHGDADVRDSGPPALG
jgi:hypothetical protein